MCIIAASFNDKSLYTFRVSVVPKTILELLLSTRAEGLKEIMDGGN